MKNLLNELNILILLYILLNTKSVPDKLILHRVGVIPSFTQKQNNIFKRNK